ncbi:MAG: 50S ribosomal protein L3 N(5)-glutamine methyltransferase [Magnetococcales bacterium]|nr:50S ribosomal protein L3 N(5)-glutamine methyltransferase [Magnetococcales bacterium]
MSPPIHHSVCTSPVPLTLQRAVSRTANRLARSRVRMETGLQEPGAEAERLVCYALSVPTDQVIRYRRRLLTRRQRRNLERLVALRTRRRVPLPYLVKEAWFAGRSFHVDRRVLIPRSLIENILDDPEGLAIWLDPGRIRRILDLGTGSGCLAVSLALAHPWARVDGSDLSPRALAVAEINRRRYHLGDRLRLIRSDLFQNLPRGCYDLIVANPPYVAPGEYATLPREYRHEPTLALRAGEGGLALVGTILRQAADHLAPGGLLVCEVGDRGQETMQSRWPDLPVEWVHFHFGRSGVFVIDRDSLVRWRGDSRNGHGGGQG